MVGIGSFPFGALNGLFFRGKLAQKQFLINVYIYIYIVQINLLRYSGSMKFRYLLDFLGSLSLRLPILCAGFWSLHVAENRIIKKD